MQKQYINKHVDHLSGLAQKLPLPLPLPVYRRAVEICRQYLTNVDYAAWSVHGVEAASIFVASREYKTPRSMYELAQKDEIDRKTIGRMAKAISKVLQLAVPLADTRGYLRYHGSLMGLSRKAAVHAEELLRKSESSSEFRTRTPRAMSAGIVYVASAMAGERKNRSEVQAGTNVNAAAIGEIARDLVDAFDLRIPYYKPSEE